ncbi:HEAT repeat domain-containing protein [Paenibacillus herberti]|uniref:HEAT repeat domain-containing protein n=1 Tax=Paenibacillus herberti TaxID=1619309 RepID=A0A229NUJ5_9BACL|nr:HEAT repeat domain-containing protein [Paenibacillus herberti]OXM13395.1 hypothetical protein CGZ75_20245 [Paenibacillus herberti]
MDSNELVNKQITDLASNNEQTAFAAIKELKRTGKEAVPSLIHALGEPGSLRTMAVVVLGELGQDAAEAVPALAELLLEDHEETQMATALTLFRIGASSLPPLFSLVQRQESGTAFWASWAIVMIDPKQASPGMIEVLNKERESSTSRIKPFAAEEALGKAIAAELEKQGELE